MGVIWTEEQQKVISLRDRNILVSAAAGSGKTAVLVERILSKICDPKKPVDIDRLLIMTFTRAAAGEMKERISAAIDQKLLQQFLSEIVEDTFNMISVDGDTSTNDTCLVLCNGLAENPVITEEDEDGKEFKAALAYVMEYLAKQIAGDGEGCTRLFEVTCNGAATKEDAKIISKSVVCSTLTKAAVFGKDANWGRILCAMGYSGVTFDPEKVDIVLESEEGSLAIVKDGIATDYSEEKATQLPFHINCTHTHFPDTLLHLPEKPKSKTSEAAGLLQNKFFS